jgi:transcriptional regulator with XRE-family HTH domain
MTLLIGNNICRSSLINEMTQAKLAEIVGVTRQTIVALERADTLHRWSSRNWRLYLIAVLMRCFSERPGICTAPISSPR